MFGHNDTMSYRRILVTGGAGFVGSSLALRLKGAFPQTRVSALDNLSRKGSELNVPRLEAGGIIFMRGDVRHAEDFKQFAGVDLIVDCAAEPSVMAGKDGSPLYALETNLWGTVNALELARTSKAKILFLSSSRVYPVAELNAIVTKETPTRFAIASGQTLAGVSENGISETFPLGEQRTLYGATKLASEMLIREYAMLYGTRAIINRCGVIAGPWQFGKVDQGVAVLWMAKHIFNQPLSYIGFGGQGKQVRDFLHIDDLWDAVALQLKEFNTYAGQTFNIGGGIGSSASLCELTELCQKISGTGIEISSAPDTRWGDIKLYVSDNARFSALSGWTPKRGVEDIMRDIHAWIIANKEALRPLLG